ncbi:MAG TPA: hypothetical protein VHC22_05765 [Pirellulales bacterium]|nr:hypothetical protein [Pirellulales bacterium]
MAAAIAASAGFAQQRKAGNQAVDTEAKIYIGQSLEDAKKALSSREIGFGEGGFAFVEGDPDRANLNAIIDKNHTYVCIYYSKASSKVTGVDMVFFRSRQNYGADNAWLPATELQIDADRTYSVKFKAPLTDEERKKLEEDRRPPQFPQTRSK